MCPPGDTGQCLEVLLLVMSGVGVTVASGEWRRGAGRHPTCTGQPSQQRTVLSQTSGVLRVRNPVLKQFVTLDR